HDRRDPLPPGQGEMHVVAVKMNQVELVTAAEYRLHHQKVVRQRIDTFSEPEGVIRSGDQPGTGGGVTTRKESDIVTQVYQCLGEKRDHPFGPAISTRGH